MEDLGTLSGRISYIIRVYELSNRRLAQIAGVSGQAIGDIISGKQKSLKPDNLKNISEKLDISIEWLSVGLGFAPKSNIHKVNDPMAEYGQPTYEDLRTERDTLKDKLLKQHEKYQALKDAYDKVKEELDMIKNRKQA